MGEAEVCVCEGGERGGEDRSDGERVIDSVR